MHWTTDKPTKPGWYWWRSSWHQRVEIVQVFMMVWNEADGEARPWCSWGWISQLDGEWAGPIPEPTDSGEEAAANTTIKTQRQRIERLERALGNLIRDDEYAVRHIKQLEGALKNLLRDAMAADFNEHWDSYQQAKAALAGEQ